MVAHEYAHAYAAFRQGDTTAQQLGRLTWNPVRHIDPFMTILLPILTWFGGGFLFGGAKPVPVSPANFHDYRRGDIIVSLAGVTTNFVMAVIATLLIIPVGIIGRLSPALTEPAAILQIVLMIGIFFNLILTFFNLLPIPPLDGSHVVKHLLPPAWAVRYEQVGRYGILIIIALLMFARDALAMVLAPVYIGAGFAIRSVLPWIIQSEHVRNPLFG